MHYEKIGIYTTIYSYLDAQIYNIHLIALTLASFSHNITTTYSVIHNLCSEVNPNVELT